MSSSILFLVVSQQCYLLFPQLVLLSQPLLVYSILKEIKKGGFANNFKKIKESFLNSYSFKCHNLQCTSRLFEPGKKKKKTLQNKG